jgi:hypothetical protein
MSTVELIEMLENFYGLPEKEQRKRRHQLLKVVGRLEKVQSGLEQELEQARKHESGAERYNELIREQDLIAELLQEINEHH